MTIEELLKYRESENKVEFKEAKGGNFSFNGGTRVDPKERRRCILGYIIAFANEGGGILVFGVDDSYPHKIVGTNQCLNATGKLEEDIYREIKIRVDTEEIYDQNGKRILILHIPSRPPGKAYKFEDVPLMRVGEELTAMSDEKLIQILQEQEPDFSEKICPNITLSDLDPQAILRMKEAYSKKQGNDLFLTLDDNQALIDLNLIKDNNKITYAALILLGKEDVIKKQIPQSAIFLEYRNDIGKITFDDRYIFSKPYFLTIDELWNTINLRNSKV